MLKLHLVNEFKEDNREYKVYEIGGYAVDTSSMRRYSKSYRRI